MDQMMGESMSEDIEEGYAEFTGDALPPEAMNLVPMYQEKYAEWLEKECRLQVAQVRSDNDSRKDWLDRRENQLKLYAGLVDPMKYPAEGAKSTHDPILCRTVLQLWARGWDQICPAKGDLMQVSPVGGEDQDASQRRQLHMNWQLRNKVPTWVTGHGESYLQFLISGSVFRAKWWDPVAKTTTFDNLTADEVIIPYARKDVDPLMRYVPRITRVRFMPRWQLEQLGDEGFYVGVDKLYPAPGEGGGSNGPAAGDGPADDSVIEKTNQEIEGVTRSVTITSEEAAIASREVFESHRWMLLPDKNRMKPVIFSVDVKTKRPLALTIREEEDQRDRMRFDAEMEEWQTAVNNIMGQYQSQLQAHAAELEQWNMADASGVPMFDPEGLPGEPPQEPEQPQLPTPPRKARMRTVHNIVHFRCFPNPHGFYGLGVGYLLENANELVNELSNEYLLAAKFANMATGLTPKNTSGKTGKIKLAMGEFRETELEAEQMPGIKVIQFPGPSEGMWKFIQAHKKDAYTLVSDVDTLSGEAGPTNETKAAAQQRNANATMLISVIVRLYLEPLKEEVKMLAHDNGVFMDEREFFWVTDPNHEQGEKPKSLRKEAMRSDYYDEFDFEFTADQRIQSQPERVQLCLNLIDRFMNSPYVQDPEKGPALFYVAFSKLFRALDMPEFNAALGPPPQPPQPPSPPQPMAQEDENQMFFKDQDHPVLPDDDHNDHVGKMQAFQASPYFGQLSSTGKQIAERHYREHMGWLYKQESQNGIGMGLQQGGGPGMGGGPGNGAVPGAPMGAPGGAPGQAPGAGPPGPFA